MTTKAACHAKVNEHARDRYKAMTPTTKAVFYAKENEHKHDHYDAMATTTKAAFCAKKMNTNMIVMML